MPLEMYRTERGGNTYECTLVAEELWGIVPYAVESQNLAVVFKILTQRIHAGADIARRRLNAALLLQQVVIAVARGGLVRIHRNTRGGQEFLHFQSLARLCYS